MIDLIGNIFGKKILGNVFGSVFGQSSQQPRSSVTPPSFSSAYMTDSTYESEAGKAEDIDTSDPNVMLQLWQRRLFSGDNSYTKITLPDVRG
jgi:hypothetical protein|tara:strand:- start:412 stop:687 length:276 start_codon:yes stop_codon:yes gene_type:complete